MADITRNRRSPYMRRGSADRLIKGSRLHYYFAKPSQPRQQTKPTKLANRPTSRHVIYTRNILFSANTNVKSVDAKSTPPPLSSLCFVYLFWQHICNDKPLAVCRYINGLKYSCISVQLPTVRAYKCTL